MRARHAVLVAVTIGLFSTATWAGVTGGTVQSVKQNRLVLEYGRDGKVKSFVVPVRTEIARGGETLKLADLEPGTRVYVYTTTSGEVYKINVAQGSGGVPKRTGTTPSTPRTRDRTETSGRTSEVFGRRDRDDTTPAAAETWSTFRGPNRANRSAATGLLTEWPEGGPRVDRVYRGLGAGYSSVSIDGDRLFTMGTNAANEMVFALDADDPETLWTFRNGTVYRDSTGDGPRGTPTIDGRNVYVLGANGDLACLDVESGNALWRKNVLQDFAAPNITWGISESPLVDGNRVVVTPGGTGATMAALDKKNGRILWRAVVPGTPQAAYASAIVCQVGDVRQYVNFTSKGLVGVKADDGTPMWGNDDSANGTANCSTPLFYSNHVFSASGYGTGGAMIRLTSGQGSTRAQLTYRAREMVNHHGGMVIVDGHVFGTNDNTLLCMDLRDGRVVWRDRSVGKGSVTFAEGHLYVVGEKGEIALVEASTEGYTEKARFRHVNRSNRPLWSHPVVHDGQLFVRDQDTLTVYDIAADDE